MIRVHTLTEATGDDATTALDLLNAVDGHLVSVIADAAYDTVALGLPDPAGTHRNVETNVHDALARLDRLLRTEARPCPSAPPASAIHSPAASLSVHEQASIVGR